MTGSTHYEALTPETLADRLVGIEAIAARVGADAGTWRVMEVGDGNLNLVFIVGGPAGTVIVKQALPYVRLVGDSWPLPLKRAFFEYQVLTREAARDPGSVPEVYHFDEAQALIVMEFLAPHVILRKKLIAGETVAGLAETLGNFCARTAFRGSDLAMATAEKKADTAMFQGNVELMAITENLVFTDPYFDAERNHHTEGLDPVVATLRADVEMKAQVQHMLMAFTANTETLCHGDLHSGSAMCTDVETKVIDPEFGFYGPMGFDFGMLISNYVMAYFSQPGHRGAEDLAAYQDWILGVIEDTVAAFEAEFTQLWNTERTGILYPKALFEDQGQSSETALAGVLRHIWQDAVGIGGIEMHRRVLSLAHNADFEQIEDVTVRAPLEARNLMMGRELILRRGEIADARALTDLARKYNEEAFL
ncbi:MAG TPA: S-methyl-5-thioribose kinase [Rhodobacteraceae bacterium]|nr:S-methyl-5-thioribose kinase [Paracoccaceae bacterium]